MANPTDIENSTDLQVLTDVHVSDFYSEVGDVLVRCDSSYPIMLRGHNRAGVLIAMLGQPDKITEEFQRVHLRWINPNVCAVLHFPVNWLLGRKVVSASASQAAFLAATRFAIAGSDEAAKRVDEAKLALAQAQAGLEAALTAEERAHRRHGVATVVAAAQNIAAKSGK